ncbi:AHH domain-containing protein [Pseudoalteromonas ruthenica]|uniref:AHH domain-containing protein n=1 Tax=Pseudoalteromonas ruthenica TaxID=151081 RepID=UPI00034D9D49|nr:AHH domain-containing protein [Pseudoalteromonas ruthenica]
MQGQQEEYITVQELEQDLTNATGNPALAKAQAQQYAIFYRGEVIDAMRYRKGLISKEELVYSKHIRWEHNKSHSKRLSDNMIAAGRGPREENTAAHHIVSWNDIRAARSRLRLAAFGIDIDHEANGVFLPRFAKHKPMESMPNAEAHSKIHTNEYYLNVEALLVETIGEGLGRQGIIDLLRDIGDELLSGDFPIHEELSTMLPR